MVTEQSIYQLEAYLDGAMEPAEAAAMDNRLERDPALREALARLRAGRAMRTAVWESLEATPAEAAVAGQRFVTAARRLAVIDRRIRAIRRVGMAAAVVALGFGIGWTTHAILLPQRTATPMAHAPRVGNDEVNAVFVAHGAANRQQLGVYVTEIDVGDGVDAMRGLLVRRVVPGSAAWQAGLRTDDIILRLGEARAEDVSSFAAALASHPGIAPLVIRRNGLDRVIEVHLDAE